MEQIQVADLTVTLLSEEERNQVVAALMSDAERYTELFQTITITSDTGKQVDGARFFQIANFFEGYVPHLGLQRNLEQIEGWIKSIDALIALAPEFFQLHYLKTRIWLLALVKRENHVIENRGELDRDPSLMLLKKHVFDTYVVIEDCHRKAMQCFTTFQQAQALLPVTAYLTSMKVSLATYYRRNAAFRVRSVSVAPQSDVEIAEILQLAMQAHGLFEQMFAKDVFIDLQMVGVALATWANTLKLVPGPKDRALRYYQTARQICGDAPTIREGIKYCEYMLAGRER
jgi:hypothetical protein